MYGSRSTVKHDGRDRIREEPLIPRCGMESLISIVVTIIESSALVRKADRSFSFRRS